MKRLGLIGSQTAATPILYWQTIQDEARRFNGADGLAEVLIHASQGGRLRSALRHEDWTTISADIVTAGRGLVRAGADCLVICGSALNPVSAEVRRALGVPLIDLTHAMYFKIQNYRFRRVALLGVRTQRERRMWQERFGDMFLLEPTEGERRWFLEMEENSGIPSDVVAGKIECQRIVSTLRKAGAQAVILADHSFSRWVRANETLLPLFDAEEVHAWIAALWALRTSLTPAPPCVVA
jgi:aspartate racemase